ncbi:MAG: glycosyltransferase [Firmicutes bacterium]|nr:glycosyltransferase [Bacillota bacterium]
MRWHFIGNDAVESPDGQLGVQMAVAVAGLGQEVYVNGLGRGFKPAPRLFAGPRLTVGCGPGRRGQILLTTRRVENLHGFQYLVTTDPKTPLLSAPWTKYLPYPVDPLYFETWDNGSVFDVTSQLHLEHRPRLIFGGNYQDGAGFSMLLTTARQVIKHQGELILLNGLSLRSQLAPVVQHLGLVDVVIFAPPLSTAMESALFHSADLYLDPTDSGPIPVSLLKALAAGLPAVTWNTLELQEIAGGATLLVDSERGEVWPDAIREALENERLRERMIERGLAVIEPHNSRKVGALLIECAEQWGIYHG